MSVPEPKVEELRIDDIVVRDRLRPVTEAGVESLIASIEEIGSIKDEIHVRLARRRRKVELRLLAGAHRLEAARQLGWETIRAKVWRDIPDTLARLIEVDDNMAGAEMDALDTAIFLAERKRLYEELHPETSAGVFRGNQHTGKVAADMMSVASFAVATAEKFGLTERHVRRMIAAGAALGPGERRLLQDAQQRPTLADLQVIAKIDNAGERITVVERIARGASARAALKAVRGEVAPERDPVDQQHAALYAAWARAGAVARRRWVAQVLDELSPLVKAGHEAEDLARGNALIARIGGRPE